MITNFPLTLTRNKTTEKISVQIDRFGFERLADSLGLFNQAFLDSLTRAEVEIAFGKIKKLGRLRDLRKKA